MKGTSMKTLDLKIVTINYEEEEESKIIKLSNLLTPSLELFKQYLFPYHKVNITIILSTYKEDKENSQSVTTMKKALYIIEEILKSNIDPNFHDLVPQLASVFFRYQLNFPIQDWMEYLSKEIINPKDDLSFLSQNAKKELKVAYLLLNDSIDLFEFLKKIKMDSDLLLTSAYDFMTYRFKRNRDDLKTPEEVLEYVWQNVKYGWKNNQGEVLDHVTGDWFTEYRIPSVEEVLESQYGCCVDMARVSAYLLKELKYPSIVRLTNYYTYFHAYTIYKESEEWYRMDAESKLNPAILKVGTLKEDENLVYLENEDSKCTSVYNLPSRIDHKTIQEVYKSLGGTVVLTRNKRLANQ